MTRARFLGPARRELLAEIHHYNVEQPGLGLRFVAAVEAATARALAFPLAGSAAGACRKVLVKDFPFTLVYRADAGGIVVVAVAHHARLPGYWQSRVQETP